MEPRKGALLLRLQSSQPYLASMLGFGLSILLFYPTLYDLEWLPFPHFASLFLFPAGVNCEGVGFPELLKLQSYRVVQHQAHFYPGLHVGRPQCQGVQRANNFPGERKELRPPESTSQILLLLLLLRLLTCASHYPCTSH